MFYPVFVYCIYVMLNVHRKCFVFIKYLSVFDSIYAQYMPNECMCNALCMQVRILYIHLHIQKVFQCILYICVPIYSIVLSVFNFPDMLWWKQNDISVRFLQWNKICLRKMEKKLCETFTGKCSPYFRIKIHRNCVLC